MVEDFVTPYYQRDLAEKLTDEGWSSVAKARTNESTLHQPSGQPWWKVSARYWLEKTYPQEPGIWHSLPNATGNLRERDEDIRSRPLLANFVGAAAAINIHTNGDDNSTATRGTKVFYYPGRVEDQQLASNVLCYMKEAVHSVGNYATWKFDDNPVSVSNKGEITLAQVPAIIVELGFHTNPEDALAMQDDIFRGKAVNGMAKGWHLYSQGIGCKPLKITSIPPIQVTQNVPIDWTVNFEGHPKFPLTVTTAFKTCPSGWNCSQQTNRIYSETESPLKMKWRCNVTGTVAAATFQVESVITDDDGVRTAPQEHTVTCSPPSGAKALSSATDLSAPMVEVSYPSR
jgi:hypothetical protein